MSATPPARLLCQREELQNNMIKEENEDEIDVTQSLFTLQLSNRLIIRPKQSRGEIDKFIMPSFNKIESKAVKRLQQNSTNVKRVGYHHISSFDQSKQLNPKDTIFRKLSNYASNGEDCEENRSELEVDRNIIDITKAQKGNQSDKDDGSQAGSDEDESVLLDDQNLDELEVIKFKVTPFSFFKINNLVLLEIQLAENGSEIQQTQLQQPEEYESLVWGQSIWSTDIPKESKLQFMANLQQMQNTSDINIPIETGSGEINSKIDLITSQNAVNMDQINETSTGFEEGQIKINNEEVSNQKVDSQQKNYQININRQQVIEERVSHHFLHRHHHHYSVSPSKTDFVTRADHHQNHHHHHHHHQQRLQLELHSSHQQHHNQFFNRNNQFNQHDHDRKFQQQKIMDQYGFQNQHHYDVESLNYQLQQNLNFSNFKGNLIHESHAAKFDNFQDSGNHHKFQKEEFGKQYDHSNISNHSNRYLSYSKQQMNFGGDLEKINKSAIKIHQYDIGTEYPRDDSSNYTHHPYSQYEGNTENIHQIDTEKHEHFEQQHLHNNQQNRPQKFINRQINRYIMNPIFNSKQTITSLQMHRYSGIPWRGGSHRDMAHGIGGQLNINPATNQGFDHNLNAHPAQLPSIPSENNYTDYYNYQNNQSQSQLQQNDISAPYFGQNIVNNDINNNPFNSSQSKIYSQSYQNSFSAQNLQNQDQIFQQQEQKKNLNFQIVENLGFNQIENNYDIKNDFQNQNLDNQMLKKNAIIQQSDQENIETLKQVSINAAPFYPSNSRKAIDSEQIKNFDQQVLNNVSNDRQNLKQNLVVTQAISVTNLPQSNPALSINSQSQNQNTGGKALGTMLNNMHHKQKQAQAIHVPIPIPIMNRNVGQKSKNQVTQSQKLETNDQAGAQKTNQAQMQSQILKQQQNSSASLIFNTFYGGEILSKKNELDQKMKETTQNLELKINKAVEIDNEDDDQFSEDDDFTFEVHSAHDPSEFNSVERPCSSLNIINSNDPANIQKINSASYQSQILQNQDPLSIKNEQNTVILNQNTLENHNKHHNDKVKHYEEKVKRRNDRATIFKKLQDQLNQFKIEMFQTSSDQQTQKSPNRQNSTSKSPNRIQIGNLLKQNSTQSQAERNTEEKGEKPTQNQTLNGQPKQRLTPFRQDAKLYLDKVLNLMNMVNEVDDVTNVANLKNMLEKKKLLLLKARAERDQFTSLINKQIIENQQLQQMLKQSQLNQEKSQTDFQSLIQNMNEQNSRQINDQIVFYDHQIFELRKQTEQLNQDNHNLVNQNAQLQENIKENINFYSSQTSQLNQQIAELQNSVFQKHNQIQLQIQQIEQQNQNICLLQQNLNKSNMEQQILQQKVDNSKQSQASLERQLKETQKHLTSLQQKQQNNQSSSFKLKQPLSQIIDPKQDEADGQSQSQTPLSKKIKQQTLYQSSLQDQNDGENQQNDNQIVQQNKASIRSCSFSSGELEIQQKEVLSKDDQIEDDQLSQSSSKSSDDSMTVDEKLENANQQIKDLQNYIKKRSLEDIKNNQLKMEIQQKNDKLHQEQIEDLKKQMQLLETEKNTIIQNLKERIKAHKLLNTNEIQKRDFFEDNKNFSASKIKSNYTTKQDSINDQSIIEPRSDDSFDKDENQDAVREIINNYQCDQCYEKDRIIKLNEYKIDEYIQQIKQFQMDKLPFAESEEGQIVKYNVISSEVLKFEGSAIQRDITVNIQNLHSMLNSSQQILLNNFIRQIKHYLGGIEHNHSIDMQYKMKNILNRLESSQRISLLEEDELDEEFQAQHFTKESLQIRLETKQRLIAMSLDLLNELIILSTKLQSQLVQKQKEAQSLQSSEEKSSKSMEQKIIEKIIEKTVIQYKTIEFGMNSADLKQMQAIAKDERKACHHIIVEIEKLMYEMNSVLSGAHGLTSQVQINKLAQTVFGQILDTYLLLPHRLKPIFDHCKKIETIISKAFKQQEQILKQSQQNIQK